MLRRHLRERHPYATVGVRRFSDLIDRATVNERLLAILAGFFGTLALVLAAVGLYGVLAFGVAGRTNEIGVRTALGATRRDVLWLVLSDALRLVVLGVALGIPAIWATTRLVQGLLFGLSPTDPVTIVGAIALLMTTALAAAYLPARRAAQIDPMVALR